MLPDSAIENYLKTLSADQAENIRSVRRLVLEQRPDAVEEIDQGKWFTGLLTYTTKSGVFLFALGPRKDGKTTFHMMPYYASSDLQQRHGECLKRFLTGKSCIRFKHFADLPLDALQEILASAEQMEAMFQKSVDQRSRSKKR